MKIHIIFLVLIASFFSCNNEFDLNEKWDDIPVTYAIINPSDTAQYIRIERVFNDPNISGLDLAKNIDSIYYKGLTVKLLGENTGQEAILNLIDGNSDKHIRDKGIFTDKPNYLYKLTSSEMKILPGEKYKLIVLKDNNDTLTFGSTKTIKEIPIYRPSSANRPIKLDYLSKFTIAWDEDKNAGYYDVFLLIKIKEKSGGDEWIDKELTWKVKSKLNEDTYSILGKDFYQFLSNELPVDNNIQRKFVRFNVIIRGVGKELKDYTQVINANLGITSSQQIPTYSNMSHGYGIFTSINTSHLDNFYLQEKYLDTLARGVYTRNLNFQ